MVQQYCYIERHDECTVKALAVVNPTYHLQMVVKHCLTLELAHLVKRTCDLN